MVLTVCSSVIISHGCSSGIAHGDDAETIERPEGHAGAEWESLTRIMNHFRAFLVCMDVLDRGTRNGRKGSVRWNTRRAA